jgi:hypothetical protein
MTTTKELSKDELRWRTEEDARTLERYQEIMSDKKRLDMALAKAKETVTNLEQRAKVLNKSLTGIKKK